MNYEDKILVETSRLDWKKREIDYTQINWDKLIEKSILHKVAGTLYLPFRDDLKVPVYIFEIIEYLYFGQKMVGRKKIEEFHKVISRLHKEGVDVFLLKGIYMVPNVYQDLGLRTFGDMDILVGNDDIERACIVLNDLGYVQGEYDFYTKQLHPYVKTSAGHSYLGEFQKLNDDLMDECYSIDINNRFGEDYGQGFLNADEIRARSVPFEFGDSLVRRISNEDMVIQYCYQTFYRTQLINYIKKGREMELRSYMDIRTLIKRTEINWEKLFSLITKSNIATEVGYALYHSHLIFGDVLPADIIQKLDVQKICQLDKSMYDKWITEENKNTCDYYKKDFLTRLFTMERFTNAIGTDF